MSPRMVVLAGVLTLCGASPVAAACPFCPPSSPTWAEQYAESDAAVLVKWARSREANDSGREAQTDFDIIEVWRSIQDRPQQGQTITVDYLVQGQPGDLFLMFGQQSDGLLTYALPIEMTEIRAGYVKQAPSIEQPTPERLKFFLKFLESSDTPIANDAFAEFSRAPYDDVKAIRSQLSPEKVRRWLVELEPAEELRRGFYALMLGLCGDEHDALKLASQVLKPTPADVTRIGLDGQMAGYVLLTGQAGFDRLVQARLKSPDQPDGDVFATINALRFLWQFEPHLIPRQQVAEALASLLDQPQFAEVVLVDLARWEHWSVMDRVLKLYNSPAFAEPAAKHKILQFAMACVRAQQKTPDKTIPEVAQAEAFLKRVQQAEPETYQNASRLFGGPRPALKDLLDR
ncbi:hypothetical protein GC163_14280 [bacterium]|nr:hypothetical protein [bacterium]